MTIKVLKRLEKEYPKLYRKKIKITKKINNFSENLH